MEINGEKLTRQHLIHQKGCDRAKFNADIIYDALIDEVCWILTYKGKLLEMSENYKYILGQIALWYANDERFSGDLHKGLMIRGSVGTGKTVMAEALKGVIFLVERLQANIINAVDLQNMYSRQDEDGILNLKNRKYTIIDDLGVETTEVKNWGNVREPFNDVFDARYRSNRLTVITTNLRPSEIEEKYGTRIIDRFRECMNDLILDGKSLRK